MPSDTNNSDQRSVLEVSGKKTSLLRVRFHAHIGP